MSNPVVAPVEVLRIGTVEFAQRRTQVAGPSFHQQMVVIAHEHVRVQHQLAARHTGAEPREKLLAIAIVTKDGFALVAALR